MEWIYDREVLSPAGHGEPDGLRAWRPWVLEDDDGTLRMWYSGSDGTTSRILSAVQRSGGAWERLGIAIEAGFSGDSDSFGAESPSVVRTPGGYLMAYGGFDGEVTRLHMATAADGRRWVSHGTIMQRGAEDKLGANHPGLLVTGERWWLYFTGYDGSLEGRGAAIVAAVSQTGSSWDRVGPVLQAEPGEVAVSHPCVFEAARTFSMFFASDDGSRTRIALATSSDGLSWDRRGTVLGSGSEPRDLSAHTPCVVRLHDGSLRMWYASLPFGDEQLGYRICSARFPGPWPA